MKIIYKQAPPSEVFLDCFGIQNCYVFVKHLATERDGKGVNRKTHYHTDYEIHIVEAGSLIYEAEGKNYTLNFGHFLLLPPKTLHRVIYRSADASTISITFRMTRDNEMLPEIGSSIMAEVTPRIQDTITQILLEYQHPQSLFTQWMSAAVWETLVLLWRQCGVEEAPTPSREKEKEEDSRLTLAKQYISDNIEFAPTIEEVSEYCHLCARQLNRLFVQWENMTPKAYIQKQRIERIQALLRAGKLSLREISERMHFSSEYYFSSFFRKSAGMAPGEYRKMHIK